MRKNFKPYYRGLLLASAVCCTVVASPWAKSGDAVPSTKGQVIRDFARLTFEWPEATLFTAKTSGNDVIITFDRAANPNMANILKSLSPYITKAQRKPDGKTIVLSLNQPYRIRTFVSDNISGIDLLNITEKPTIAKLEEPKKAAEKAIVKPLLVEKKAEKPKQILAHMSDKSLAALSPAAGEETTPTLKEEEKPLVVAEKQEDKKEEAPKEAAAVPAVELANNEPQTETTNVEAKAETNEPSVAKEEIVAAPVEPVQQNVMPEVPPVEEQAKTEEPEKTFAQPVQKKMVEDEEKGTRSADTGISLLPMPIEALEPEEADEHQAKESPSAPVAGVELSETDPAQMPLETGDLKAVLSGDADAATLRFPLRERSSAAIFVRSNVLWVVFGKPHPIDASDFNSSNKTVVEKLEQIESKDATILRIFMEDNIYPHLAQQEGKTEIAIILDSKKQELANPIDVSINTEPPAPAHVFVPVLEMSKPIEVVDPLIGDTLIITPVFNLEEGVAQPRDFVEFSLLSSAQGVVVAKKADATEVTQLRNGLRVSLPKGAYLSPIAGQIELNEDSQLIADAETFFPYNKWQLEEGKDHAREMKKLLIKSVHGANVGETNLARLRMAQIYLSEGFSVEALGLLDSINRTNRSYYRSAKLAAMRGAANFLMYRFADAARDFSSAELNNNAEVEYWRSMLSELLGNQAKTFDFMAMNENYISKYPPVFRQRLAIVAADRAIAEKEYNTALKIFDTLKKDEIIAPIQPYVEFLTAKIAAENGQGEEASEAWDKLAANDIDPFVQARAEFSRILWGMDNNTIDQDRAIDRLERLRLNWHGDSLELQIVELLGDLYFSRKDYVNAMRVWQIGVTGFKNTGPAIEMGSKMQDVFVKLFNEGIADTMPPIDALALFYEYRAYTPPGSAGLQMIEALADRLVGVDLLNSAAQLLEQQMRAQLEKEERSRIGAKLADIHLRNNNAKKAMQILQDSVYGENPILVRIKRNQLSAEAMLLLGSLDEALTMLGQDDSQEAEKLRTMIFWQKKDWPNIISSIENILKKREDITAPITVDESQYILRLALAYIFQNDEAQVQYMRDYFTPLMKNNPHLEAFKFITAPDIRPTTRNFEMLIEELDKTKNFISAYKASTGALTTATAAPAAPATPAAEEPATP